MSINLLPDEFETIVKQAMQDEWEEICSDTGCHPLDIEHGRGRRLSFIPLHWASAVAASVRSQAEAIIAAKDAKIDQLKDWYAASCLNREELEDDNAALTARVKAQTEYIATLESNLEAMENRTEALEAQLAAARKALEFYGNLEHWKNGRFEQIEGGTVLRHHPSSAHMDRGTIARAALEGNR